MIFYDRTIVHEYFTIRIFYKYHRLEPEFCENYINCKFDIATYLNFIDTLIVKYFTEDVVPKLGL